MDKMVIKPDGSWEFRGEDSRLTRGREAKQVTWKIKNPLTGKSEWATMDRVYCMNCGADGGVSARSATYVRYFCQACWPKIQSTGQFIPMATDEEFRWRNGLKEKD
jgi:hypothetical protein